MITAKEALSITNEVPAISTLDMTHEVKMWFEDGDLVKITANDKPYEEFIRPFIEYLRADIIRQIKAWASMGASSCGLGIHPDIQDYLGDMLCDKLCSDFLKELRSAGFVGASAGNGSGLEVTWDPEDIKLEKEREKKHYDSLADWAKKIYLSPP